MRAITSIDAPVARDPFPGRALQEEGGDVIPGQHERPVRLSGLVHAYRMLFELDLCFAFRVKLVMSLRNPSTSSSSSRSGSVTERVGMLLNARSVSSLC